MKYRILFLLLLLGTNTLWAMQRTAARDSSKGKEEPRLLAPSNVLEGEDTVLKANPKSSEELDALFPPCEEDEVLYREESSTAVAQNKEDRSLFDTLLRAQAKISEIKSLPEAERAARTKELDEAIEILLRKRAQNVHEGQKLSREQLESQRKKEEAIAASQRVDSSVELNAQERRLLGEVAREVNEILPKHRQADLEAVLQDMSPEESRGFWRWATSWVPKISCVVQ